MMSAQKLMVSSEMVGREHEMEILDQVLQAALNGSGCCVLLAGEAGIGKTRLIEALRQHATEEKITILQGDCLEQTLSYPYAPWIDALRAFVTPFSPTKIKRLLGPLTPEIMKLLPELALLIPQVQPLPTLEPQAEKYRMFEVVTRFILSLLSSKPVLIILEDLHWCDAQSLELIQYLVRRLHHRPLILIGTYRDERLSPHLLGLLLELNRERLVQEIRLRPLNRNQIEQLISSSLDIHSQIPSGFADAILVTTNGNPFFVEEILKDLIGTGQIDELLNQDTLVELPVPHSIQRMVRQRVEQLPEASQKILIYASAIGQRFNLAPLIEISGQDEPVVMQALREAVAFDLVVLESADNFAFKHELTRDAIYSMIMLREFKVIHRRVAEALERLDGKRIKVTEAQLGYLFYHAGIWQKATEYSRRAGERALALNAPREVITHFTRAIDAARQAGIPLQPSYSRSRAHAYELLGDFDHARRDYEMALEVASQDVHHSGEWQSLIDLGFLWQSRDWVRAGEYFNHAYDLANSLEDKALIAQSLNRIGHWRTHGSQIKEAISDHQKALRLFMDLNDQLGIAQTLELLGIANYFAGNIVQGAAYCEQALPILRALDDRQGLVNTMTNLSLRVRFDTEVIGDIDLYQLTELSETALEIARSCDYRAGEAAALHEGAVCLCRAGEFGRAFEKFRQALSISEEIGHRELLTSVHQAIGGEYYLGVLALAEAREHLESAHAAALERGSAGQTLFVMARLSSLCILQNDLVRAREVLHRVIPDEVPSDGDLPVVLRSCWMARAELELAAGNSILALEIIDRLLDSTVNLKQYGPQSVPHLSHLRGRVLVTLGRIEEGIAEFKGAHIAFKFQGQKLMLWQLNIALGKAYRKLGLRKVAEQEFSSARTIVQDLANTLPEGALRDHFIEQAMAAIPPVPVISLRQALQKEFGGLTQREREVAVLIAQGKSNREIAEILVITVRTVESNITRILDKLGYKSRTEIATWAIMKGLLRPPELNQGKYS